jgi:predicted SAM-dependent methyltransferase
VSTPDTQPASSSWRAAIGRIRIVGHLCRVLHGVIFLPDLRADLAAGVESANSEIASLDARLGSLSAAAADLNDRLGALAAATAQLTSTVGNAVAAAQDFPESLRFFGRQQHQLGLRQHEIQDRLDGLSPRISVSEQSASRLAQIVEHLQAHVRHFLEIMRSELLSEVHGQMLEKKNGEHRRLVRNPLILLQPPETPIKLNLGCGTIPLIGYINVDLRDLVGVDLVSDIVDLPFDPGTVTEIYSSHTIEHFTERDLRDKVLPHWRTLLRPGGLLRVIVPDTEAMLEGFAERRLSFEDLRTVLLGGQDYGTNYHLNMFSYDALKQTFSQAGFVNPVFAATARKNGLCLEMELMASKPDECIDSY